jgi:hypothetical protein
MSKVPEIRVEGRAEELNEARYWYITPEAVEFG